MTEALQEFSADGFELRVHGVEAKPLAAWRRERRRVQAEERERVR